MEQTRNPETPIAGTLHHVELYVSDLRTSLRFWKWLLEQLGYVLYQQWESGQSWRLGTTYIVFVQVTGGFSESTYDRRGVGLNHLAFHARSRSQVDEVSQQLAARGSRLLYGDRYPAEDYYAIYFEDPDGIKVELVAPPNED